MGNGVVYEPLKSGQVTRIKQLGPMGTMLCNALEALVEKPFVPAALKQLLEEADAGIIQPNNLDEDDERGMPDLLEELRTMQRIVGDSDRCARAGNPETEWNNQVHSRALELALGRDRSRSSFLSITTVQTFREYCPTLLSRSTKDIEETTGSMVDFAISLTLSPRALEAFDSLFGYDYINHVDHETLRTTPIAISIETKTLAGNPEEARVQLGIWLAAQVAGIERLLGMMSEADSQTGSKSGDSSRPERLSPRTTRLLSEVIFPLLCVHGESWELYLGRVCPEAATSLPTSTLRRPVSRVEIYSSVPLGKTSDIVQVYRLVKSLRLLNEWVDVDFRKWWNDVLQLDEGEAV